MNHSIFAVSKSNLETVFHFFEPGDALRLLAQNASGSEIDRS